MTDIEARLSGAEGKQVVVDGLRAAISRGDMSPGQRLVEADLVENFGASRGSVRAAMDDLIVEGLVERIPHRGARVRAVSLEEAVSILECRGVLEGLLAARAAQRITDDESCELRELGDAMRRAVAEGEIVTYSRANARLHARISEIAGQETASALIERLRAQIVRHQFQLYRRPGRTQVSLSEHLDIIDAVVSRDATAAERAARDHLDSVISALLSEDFSQ